jgi:hypothetical protein
VPIRFKELFGQFFKIDPMGQLARFFQNLANIISETQKKINKKIHNKTGQCRKNVKKQPRRNIEHVGA